MVQYNPGFNNYFIILHFSPYSASGFRQPMKKKIFLDGPRATRSTIKKKKRWGSGDENASWVNALLTDMITVHSSL